MKLAFIITALILFQSLGAQKDQSSQSKWLDNSSGNATPSGSDYTSVKKGMVLYCLSNDETNMYVDIKFTESIEQGKVLQMGLVLWVNPDGKSRKITGIRYPIGSKNLRSNMGRGRNAQSGLGQETPLSLANTIELIGFKDVVPNRFPSKNTDNFRGYVKYDSVGNLLYSMTIPLAKLPAVSKDSKGKSPLMTIAIEYGAPPQIGNQGGDQSGFPSASSGGGRSGGGGSRTGGGGSRSGGGGGGGGAMGGQPGMGPGGQVSPKPELIWIKNIGLAVKR